MKCPKRKEAITNKRKEDREQKEETYTNVTKRSINAPTPPTTIPSDTHAKIFTCMMHAHFMNMANPGSYEEELNKILELNNLPTIKVPSNPPSASIITRAYEAESTPEEMEVAESRETAREEQEQEQTATQRQPKKQGRGRKNRETAEEEQEQEEKTVTQRQEKSQGAIAKRKKTKAKDIGLTIITPKSTGWPQGLLSKKALMKGLQENKYKYTYKDITITDEELMNLINEDNIDLEDCFKIEEDSIFRKIRSGLTQERSPSYERIRERKHSR